jgi:hypothetical protein
MAAAWQLPPSELSLTRVAPAGITSDPLGRLCASTQEAATGAARWAWRGVSMMRRAVWTTSAGLVLALCGGCISGPLLDNPLPLNPGLPLPVEHNPVFVALGPTSYGLVFENVLQTLADFGFEIADSNRYDGHIETVPRIAPGLGLFLRPGSPDTYERLLATFQTYRHRVVVMIQPADSGGFFIRVIAYKDLEDLPQPVKATAGAAIFRTENNVERTFEVIDPTIFEAGWLPRGRDTALEQAILRRIKGCM